MVKTPRSLYNNSRRLHNILISIIIIKILINKFYFYLEFINLYINYDIYLK